MILVKKIRALWADKDERNLLINILWAFVIKGASLFIAMYSMPMYMKYFNDDAVLGIWYTVLSLLSWIMVCDLGLGNGLRNRLTEALAIGDKQAAKKFVSSTYVALSTIIMPIMIIGIIILQFVNLNRFLNISENIASSKTLHTAITILFCGICLSFVVKTINVVFYAVQKPSINNFLSLFTSVLPLLYVIFVNGGDVESNLINLSILNVAAINIPSLVATVIVFTSSKYKEIAPSLKVVNFSTSKNMLAFGMQFFFAQIFFMFLMTTNEIFITRMFLPADVVEYSIYYKLFTAIGSLFTLALTPMWSKVTKDLAQKKYATIQRTNRILYCIAGMAVLTEFASISILQWVMNIWLKDESIKVNYLTAAIFALFGGAYIFNIVLTTVANGIGDLRTQIIIYGIGSLLKIPLIMLLKMVVENWNVVVLYSAVVLLMFCIFQLFWIENKIKKCISVGEKSNVTFHK